MLGPFATASRRTPPVLHCHSPGVATVARRLRIDVHNNDDNNNEPRDRGDRYGPTEWTQLDCREGGMIMSCNLCRGPEFLVTLLR